MEMNAIQSALLEVRDHIMYTGVRQVLKEFPDVVYGYQDVLESNGYRPSGYISQVVPYAYTGIVINKGNIPAKNLIDHLLVRLADFLDQVYIVGGPNRILAATSLRGIQVCALLTIESKTPSNCVHKVHIESYLQQSSKGTCNAV